MRTDERTIAIPQQTMVDNQQIGTHVTRRFDAVLAGIDGAGDTTDVRLRFELQAIDGIGFVGDFANAKVH